MSRTQIVRDIYNQQSKREFWEEWVEKKEKSISFGSMVAYSIRQEIEERINIVEKENRELKSKIEKYENLKTIIQKVGMNPEEIHHWNFPSNFRQKIEELKRGFPEGFDGQIESVIRHLQNVRKTIWGEK